MPIPWEGLGVAGAAFVAMLTKTLYNGKGRAFLKARRREHNRSTNADEAMPQVVEKLETIDAKQDKTYRKVEDVGDKADRNAYLIREFHGDEDIDVSVNDVLDDDDFYRDGDG